MTTEPTSASRPYPEGDLPPVPARILNEHVYCPRLAYLEWPGQGFTDNPDTVEGRFVHRNIERPRGSPPEPEALAAQEADPPATTSIQLSSERLGLTAKLDLVEFEKGKARPFEYKRGRPRSKEEPLWEPELTQLAAQALLLRETGYIVDELEVYFAETRSRHRVPLTEELIERTMQALCEVRQNALEASAPPPLVDSPKCPRCSLIGLCLPDEINYLRREGPKPDRRRLIVSDSPATPLYATTQGSRLAKRGGRAVLIEDGEEVQTRRLVDISHVAAFGNVDIGSALLRELFDRGVPVLWMTYGGWLSGVATGMPPGNVTLRLRQHRAAMIGAAEIARTFVAGKIRNSRTLLRRHRGKEAAVVIDQLADLARKAGVASDATSLLGIEGTAARIYFQEYGELLKPQKGLALGAFDFTARTRRPPKDRVNALLSFLYSMLTKDAVIAVLASGMDPYVGLYHRPRFGRPALALDLAEEFRSLVCDSTALMVVNNGEVTTNDFIARAGAVSLTKNGRKQVIRAYERRMSSELTHPVFGYRASYRRSLEIQARLLAATLVGDLPAYRPLTTR